MNPIAAHPPGAPDRPREDVRVMTVDDQPVFLQIARALIEVTPGFEPVGEATSGGEALALATELEPDLVLLDVRMARLDGIETARRLHADHPQTLVVLVSADDLDDIAPMAGSCGAVALVRKQDLNPALLRRLFAHREGP